MHRKHMQMQRDTEKHHKTQNSRSKRLKKSPDKTLCDKEPLNKALSQFCIGYLLQDMVTTFKNL